MAERSVIHMQQQMIASLMRQFEQGGKHATLYETHLSWIIVTDQYAYKFKKALRFDFVDYSTLPLRLHYCMEELRLNRRFAPSIYLNVVPVAGSALEPWLEEEGVPIDYALKMNSIEQSSLWDYRMEKQLLRPAEIDQLAEVVAQFHMNAVIAPSHTAWGSPDIIRSIALANFSDLAGFVRNKGKMGWIDQLAKWEAEQGVRLHAEFMRRKGKDFVRECHGDLHCGNILTMEGTVQVFDCIEFNDSLRWIDVINDISFIYMELAFHGHKDYASRFLSLYLEHTGDYDGLRLLPYYEMQRALVRSKVAFLKSGQALKKRHAVMEACQRADRYLAYAYDCIAERQTCVMITYGFSGSGKTTFARKMVELTGAVQLRSDIERMRMPGMKWQQEEKASKVPIEPKEPKELNEGIYRPDKSRQVYEHLCEQAGRILEAGFPVIVDATFLRREHRMLFQALASRLKLPFYIFHVLADETVMRKRIAGRQIEGSDESEATQEVLNYQLSHDDRLSGQEMDKVIEVDMNHRHDDAYFRRLSQICLINV